jgi:hypothetical protein
VGFYAGLTGLDRIGLARYLRQIGVRAQIVQSLDALEAGLAAGDFTAAISEELTARRLAGARDMVVQLMPPEVERYRLGIGLWRGDVTLLQVSDVSAHGTV